jgi:organic hydroperoxide reductase OsmC/OhrA
MQPFPHHYSITATARAEGDVSLEGERLPTIPSAPPTEFGGPGDRWSPETLLVAAVADCFVLTFRGIAGLSRFSWSALECHVTGTVERVESTESRNTRTSRSRHGSKCRQARTRTRRGAS